MKGVPTGNAWLRTFRNLDNLNALRANILELSGCTKQDTYTSRSRSSNEFFSLKCLLRKNKYISITSSKIKKLESDLEINQDLDCFYSHVSAQRNLFFHSMLENEPYSHISIHITEAEKEKADNFKALKVQEMKVKLETEIAKLPPYARPLHKDNFNKLLESRPRKAELVDFYQQLKLNKKKS